MVSRQIALLAALAMLAGLFLPWIVTPIGSNLAPWDALPAFERGPVEDYVRNATPEVLVFLGSFLLAALFVVVSIVGQEKRSLAFLTGIGPVGLAGYLIWQNREALALAELEYTMEEATQYVAQASAILGTGGWIWIGGAVVLLLLSIFDPGRAKPRPVTASRW